MRKNFDDSLRQGGGLRKMSQTGQSLLTELPVLYSAKYIDAENQSLRLLRERDDLTSLIYIRGGRGEGNIESVTYSVRQGDLIICHPSVDFDIQSSAEQSLRVMQLSFSCRVLGKDRGYLFDPGQYPVVPLGNHFQIFEHYFETIVRDYNQPSEGSVELIDSLMNAVIITILRIIEEMKTPRVTSMVQDVKAYIENNFEQELSVKDLAELVFVSPYHLIHMFKKEVGMSPIQFLIFCRIEEAKQQLAYTESPVNEISARIGYPNPSYFNQIFKKTVGISPGKYRSDAKR
jgi:AraC-like DNA-binding protein